MPTSFHFIEANIRYLLTSERGRQSGVGNGYRGQFHYEGEEQAWDGFQYFPDLQDDSIVPLGTKIRVFVQFREETWEAIHSKRLQVGMSFQIREGKRIVGRGVVTKLEVDPTVFSVR